MSLSAGERLGPYEIVGPIGRGGMGEVFRARDPRLGREVAIKILPARMASDAAAVARFEQEARAVAALSHPHIVGIHDVGRSGDVVFAVTELLEGETLRERLGAGKLTIRKAIDIGLQIAQGLAAAHAKGIIHRDLKPDNIFITTDGHAKILDFGLAKVDREVSSDETTVAPQTDPGTVMGTAGYLSPEQAAARPVDARSDTFSFGAVLYEMLTGRRAFKGDSTIDTLHAIVHDQPPPVTKAAPDAPTEVRWLLDKCLAKDPDERYQSTRDLVVDLRNVIKTLDSTQKLPVTPDSPRSARPMWPIFAVAAAAVAVAGVAAVLWSGRSSPSSDPAGASATTVERITTLGTVIDAAVSPDGKYVAYVTSENALQGLSLRQLASGSTIELVPGAAVGFWGIAFSPDGESIYYTVFEPSIGRTVYRIPVIGGTPRKVFAGAESEPTFSPDGRRFAVVRENFPAPGESSVMVADIDGQNVRTLATRKPPEFFSPIFFTAPAWSPDGRIIVVPMERRENGAIKGTLVALNAADGSVAPFPVYEWPSIGHPTWTPDGAGVIVVGNEQPSRSQLWWVSATRQERRQITSGLTDYRKATLTADGKSIVAVSAEATSAIWIAPIDGKTDPVRIGNGRYDGVSGVAAAPGGRLLYRSVESGSANIWVMDETGANRTQVTTDGTGGWPVSMPDGKSLIFARQQAGLWQIGVTGEGLRQVAGAESGEFPAITPDGSSVVYTSVATGVDTLFRVPSAGGQPQRMLDVTVRRPSVSGDGKQIAFYYASSPGRLSLGYMPLDGQKPLGEFPVAPSGAYAAVRWTLDGKALLHNSAMTDRANIWLQPIAGGEPRKITRFGDQAIMAFDRSWDGTKLYIARGTLNRDAVIIRGFR